jgi:hypothetical protein
MGGRQSSSSGSEASDASDASESVGDVGPVAEWLERVNAFNDAPYDAEKLLEQAKADPTFDEVTRMHLNISLRYAGSWAAASANVRADNARLLGGRSLKDAAVVLLTIVHTHDMDAATLVEDMRFMFDDEVADKVEEWTQSVRPLGTPLAWEEVRPLLLENLKAAMFYHLRRSGDRDQKNIRQQKSIVKRAVRIVFS